MKSGITLIIISCCLLGFGQSKSTYFISAIQENDLNEVRDLIIEGIDPNVIDSNGATALMWSIYKADLSVTKLLIESGANPFVKGVIYLDSLHESWYGNLLGIAAGEGDLNTLKYLIEDVGISVNDKEYDPVSENNPASSTS